MYAAASTYGIQLVVQPVEVYVDDESKLTLHGLVQHYTMLSEDGKNKRLMDLLDQLDFNQVWGLKPAIPPCSRYSAAARSFFHEVCS